MSDTAQFLILLAVLVAIPSGFLLRARFRQKLIEKRHEAELEARVKPKRTTPKQRRKADEKFRKHRGGGPR